MSDSNAGIGSGSGSGETDKEIVVDRFTEAGLSEYRFINVLDGEKGTRDHDTRYSDPQEVPGTNYGIYAGANPAGDRWLIDVDIDDYSEDADSDALDAVRGLPETLTVASPHTDGETGGHRYYYIEGKDVPESIAAIVDAENPGMSWGEIRVHNQYVVGPGSQLDGCGKEWCEECATEDGGWYEIARDTRISEITLPDLFDVLRADESDDTAAQTGSGVDTSQDTPNADGGTSHARAVADHYQNIRDYLMHGSSDRSESDFHVCCRLIEHGVPESEAYRLLAKNGNSKVDAEDAPRDYWARTWQKADRKVGSDAGSESLPASARPDGGSTAETPTPGSPESGSLEPLSGGSAAWEDVRTTYQAQTSKVARVAATDALEAATDWMYVTDSDKLWVYDSDQGFFKSWGEQTAHRILERELHANYTQNEAKEILGRLKARNQTRRNELNAKTRDTPLLCVGNGVVDLETGDLRNHSPDYKFTRGVAWDYDQERANPEPVREFLDDVTKREADRDTILDHLAHGLMPGHPYRAFVMMYGPGSNGKTRVGKLIRGFVGEDNAASVELQDLTGDDSFATGGLPGAFVNVGDDVSVGEIRDTSIIKSLTGDGTIRANQKYKKQFEFENEAAMFFSANEPPRIREQTDAISDRLYPIEMPYRFVDNPTGSNEKAKVPGIAEELLNDDAAMRGLLVLAVDHARDVINRNGQYAMPEGPAERREMYESASDPIKRFAIEHLTEASSGSVVLKADAYSIYTEMCNREGERAASEDVFKRKVGEMATLGVESTRTRKLTPGENRERAWRYVEFAESATDLMSPKLRERYAENTVASDDTATPLGATPLATAAQEPTGYATVSVDVLKVATPDGDTTPALTATVKDETTAIDVVAWDDPDALTPDTAVLIENAEVAEYQGQTQLQIQDAVTQVTQIQSGVAHTAGEPPAENQTQLDETSESPDIVGAKGTVKHYLVNQCHQSDTVTVPEIASRCDLSPTTAEETLENIATTTTLVEATDDGWEVL